MNSNQYNKNKREKIKIAQRFDRAAQSYTAAATLQQKVGDHLLELFDDKPVRAKHIIDLGAGNGLFSEQLISTFLNGNTDNYLINVDMAHRMLKYSVYQNDHHVNRVCADFDMLPYKDNSIDFIFSNLALQWSLDMEKTFFELYRVLSERGTLLFSMPISGSLYELHQSIKFIDPTRIVNHFFDACEIKDILLKVGLNLDCCEIHRVCLLYNNFHELVHNLRDTGTNHIKYSKGSVLASKNFFKQVAQAYQKFFDKNNQLPITFYLLYIKADKSG